MFPLRHRRSRYLRSLVSSVEPTLTWDPEPVEQRVDIGGDARPFADVDRLRGLQPGPGHERDDAVVLADCARRRGGAQRTDRHPGRGLAEDPGRAGEQ